MNPQHDKLRELGAKAYDMLFDEFIDAFHKDPATLIQTPGFKPAQHSVGYVVSDSLAGVGSEAAEAEMHRIVAMAALSQDPELRLRAQAWIAERAKAHADFHCDDLVAQMLGDE